MAPNRSTVIKRHTEYLRDVRRRSDRGDGSRSRLKLLTQEESDLIVAYTTGGELELATIGTQELPQRKLWVKEQKFSVVKGVLQAPEKKLGEKGTTKKVLALELLPGVLYDICSSDAEISQQLAALNQGSPQTAITDVTGRIFDKVSKLYWQIKRTDVAAFVHIRCGLEAKEKGQQQAPGPTGPQVGSLTAEVRNDCAWLIPGTLDHGYWSYIMRKLCVYIRPEEARHLVSHHRWDGERFQGQVELMELVRHVAIALEQSELQASAGASSSAGLLPLEDIKSDFYRGDAMQVDVTESHDTGLYLEPSEGEDDSWLDGFQPDGRENLRASGSFSELGPLFEGQADVCAQHACTLVHPRQGFTESAAAYKKRIGLYIRRLLQASNIVEMEANGELWVFTKGRDGRISRVRTSLSHSMQICKVVISGHADEMEIIGHDLVFQLADGQQHTAKVRADYADGTLSVLRVLRFWSGDPQGGGNEEAGRPAPQQLLITELPKTGSGDCTVSVVRGGFASSRCIVRGSSLLASDEEEDGTWEELERPGTPPHAEQDDRALGSTDSSPGPSDSGGEAEKMTSPTLQRSASEIWDLISASAAKELGEVRGSDFEIVGESGTAGGKAPRAAGDSDAGHSLEGTPGELEVPPAELEGTPGKREEEAPGKLAAKKAIFFPKLEPEHDGPTSRAIISTRYDKKLAPLMDGTWLTQLGSKKQCFFQVTQDKRKLMWRPTKHAWMPTRTEYVWLTDMESMIGDLEKMTIRLTFVHDPAVCLAFKTHDSFFDWWLGLELVLLLLCAPTVPKGTDLLRDEETRRALLQKLGFAVDVEEGVPTMRIAREGLQSFPDAERPEARPDAEQPVRTGFSSLVRKSEAQLSSPHKAEFRDGTSKEIRAEALDDVAMKLMSKLTLRIMVDVIDFSELKLGSLIGKGAGGMVYTAWCAGRPVAVKRYEDVLDALPEVEALQTASGHRNVVELLALCYEAGTLYLIMELCPRGSLHQMLREQRAKGQHRVELGKLLQLVRGIAAALVHLHSQHPPILHRNATPSNILVADNNTVKLGDFACSQFVDYMTSTATGSEAELVGPTRGQYGTLNYAAPDLFQDEYFEGQPFRGVREALAIDVFVFGSTLWEILTLQTPFEDCTAELLAAKLVLNDTEFLRLPRPDFEGADPIARGILEQLADLVEAARNFEPLQRPSAAEVLKCIDALCAKANVTP